MARFTPSKWARPGALGGWPETDATRLRSAWRASPPRSGRGRGALGGWPETDARRLRSAWRGSSSQDTGDGRAHVGGAPDERGPRLRQRGHLLRRRALAPRDDGARVAHAPAGRRGLAADEGDDRFLHAALDEGRRILLGRPADLTDQHDRLGGGIVGDEREHVDEARAVHWVAADPDARGLADPAARQLAHDLVGQGAAARDDADGSGRVDVSRHDADLRLARRDDAGTIRPDEARRLLGEVVLHAHHVRDRDPLGDAHDQRHAGGRGLHDGVGRRERRHEDQGAVGGLGLDRLRDRVPDGEALVRRPALARRHPADDGGAVLLAARGVERPLAAGDALDDHARGLRDEDAHFTPFASATTLRAPSPMSSAITSARPDSASIRLPSSTFVPSARSTMGSVSPSFVTAAITPSARRSTRRIPPNTLMKTAFTLGSEERMRNAFSICSGEAPPPTSRKFAGSPPASLTMSIVAIARPAPFTMQPTVPSSLM